MRYRFLKSPCSSRIVPRFTELGIAALISTEARKQPTLHRISDIVQRCPQVIVSDVIIEVTAIVWRKSFSAFSSSFNWREAQMRQAASAIPPTLAKRPAHWNAQKPSAQTCPGSEFMDARTNTRNRPMLGM